MSKFNVRVPGQGDQVLTQAPAQQLREDVPQAEGSIFDELQQESPAVQAAAAAPSFEQIEAQEQQEIDYDLQSPEAIAQRQQEAITPLHQRREEARVDKFEAVTTPQATADFGLDARSNALIKKANAPEVVDRIAVGGGIKPVLDAVGVQQNAPLFLKTLSYTTENFLADLATGESDVDFASLTDSETRAIQDLPQATDGKPRAPQTISKAQGNQQLGQQIHREYQRIANEQAGRPTDDYVDLTPEQATVLGDMAKELYYESNRDQMERVLDPNGQIYFVPSSKLQEDFSKGAQFRKRLFPKQHVRPAKNPLPRGEFVGERKQLVKGTTGKVGKGKLNDRVIKQAASNLNQVANVVDKQRMRILFSTILPALLHREQAYGTDPVLDTFAEINNFGPDKYKKFKAMEQVKFQEGDTEYNADKNLRDLKSTVAQALLGISQERHGANHLTYDMQAFNGRLSPQQTHFDPTTSKAVRFVTRNAVPVTVKPGSQQERNLIQMYSLIIGSKGTDALLPEGRVQAMESQTPQLLAWGQRLNEVLNNSMTDQQAEAIAQAIQDGVALTDPNFPQYNPLALDPEQDAGLLKAIRDKGEDGPAFIDGLIDFTKYQAAKKRGVPHYTYFNAYIDGKTNGLASNGIQMGSEQVALRTGVLRSPASQHAVDNDVDIRDQMMDIMDQAIKKQGFDGMLKDDYPELYTIAEAVVNHRQLAKDTTMTFGYGKDIDSFKSDIKDTAYELAQDNPEVAYALDNISPDIDWESAILSKYAEGLQAVMSKEAIESRHMMWAVASMNAMADSLMTMESYTGLELRFGDTVTAGEKEGGPTSYDIYSEGDTKGRAVGARHYETRATSAATRTRTSVNPETGETVVSEDVGGWAWGGAVPGPVQSLDAATVALTVTGDSWKKLRHASKGNPYIHSIYDAFKMDANGYHVILEEVNKNWLKSAMEWSYLKEAKDSFDKAEADFREKLKGKADKELVDLQAEFPFIASLLDTSKSSTGNFPTGLYKKMKALLEFPPSVTTPDQKHEYTVEKVHEFLSSLGIRTDKGRIDKLPAEKVKQFQQNFFKVTNIRNRMNKLIHATDKNKKELEKKIKAQGPGTVYQYYTH